MTVIQMPVAASAVEALAKEAAKHVRGMEDVWQMNTLQRAYFEKKVIEELRGTNGKQG